MINSNSAVITALGRFDEMSPYPLVPFWDMPDFGDDPFWGKSQRDTADTPLTLFISGPSRNGNHLIHSMLDNHPDLPRAPGEDSLLPAFFDEARRDPSEARRMLTGADNLDWMLSLTGFGENKWKDLYELQSIPPEQRQNVWAGVQDGNKFAADYQDTVVSINYPGFLKALDAAAKEIRNAPTFVDAFNLFLDTLVHLDHQPRGTRYKRLLVGSGMRAEIAFLLPRTNKLHVVTPIRPFENYYYSFAKGRMKTEEIQPDVLKEAWEHWLHKTVDYLLLQRTYPDRVRLINFVHVIRESAATAEQICDFLKIVCTESCFTPTAMGTPTKGNSSFPKGEERRGQFYSSGLDRNLPQEFWPELYPALWRMVEAMSI